MLQRPIFSGLLVIVGLFTPSLALGESVPNSKPLATIDLTTEAGTKTVQGEWRYSDIKIIETNFWQAGSDGQPSTIPNRAYDYEPHAGARDFNDSNWLVISPTGLSERRTAGKLSFNWYRITLTIPKQINDFDPTGSTVVFQTELDDYAEIWVNGELPRYQGQSGQSVVAGWNTPNRLIIGENIKPGEQIQLAIFGINGPISQPPTNYIYMREARLDFYAAETSQPIVMEEVTEANIKVERFDPALDKVISRNPKAYKIATGFLFTEGPVWKEDYLLFSDPNANIIYKYVPATKNLSVFRSNSGYSGADIARYTQPGANGNTFDPQGRLTTDEHGNRRVTRTELDGTITVMADKYEGKRLNSPNDLVYRSDGALYFTDPPFGLPKFYDDPAKELDFSGVYLVKDGKIQLLTKELIGPNGIAFSPDEKYLYVGNWDTQKVWVMRYPVKPDGTIGKGEIFLDLTGTKPTDQAIDGIKVDVLGNLYISGPGGVYVVSPEGKKLGLITVAHPVHNMAWGGENGQDLYMMAENTIYRVPLLVKGIRPNPR